MTATLEDIMCEHPIKVNEDVSIGSAAHLLLRYRINGVLIVSRDNEDELIGVFTTTDALRLIDEAFSTKIKKAAQLKKFAEMKVGEVSRKEVITFQKDVSVAKAIAIMRRKKVHTLPVFDGDKLVGVVGRHDLLNVALSLD